MRIKKGYFFFILFLLIQSCTTKYKPNEINAIRCNLFSNSTKQEYIFNSRGKLYFKDTNNKLRPLKKKIISQSGNNNHVKVFISSREGDYLNIKINTYFENISNQELHETIERINLRKKFLVSIHKYGNNSFKSKGKCEFVPYKTVGEVSKWS